MDRENNQELYSELVSLIYKRRDEKAKRVPIIDEHESVRYSTNLVYIYLMKYSILAFSLLGIANFIDTVTHFEDSLSMGRFILELLASLVFVYLFFRLFNKLKDKFVRAEIYESCIEYKSKGQRKRVFWIDVKSIVVIPFVNPVIYKVNFTNGDYILLVGVSFFVVVTPFWVFDLSSAGRFFKKKVKTYI